MSVRPSVARVKCAKTAEPIEMPFRGQTLVGPVNLALVGVGPNPQCKGIFEGEYMPVHFCEPPGSVQNVFLHFFPK